MVLSQATLGGPPKPYLAMRRVMEWRESNPAPHIYNTCALPLEPHLYPPVFGGPQLAFLRVYF